MDHKEKYKKALQVRCGGSRIISDEPVTFEQAIAWLEKQGEKKVMTQLEKETMEIAKRATRKYIYNEVDWEHRRYEIARDVLASIMSENREIEFYYDIETDEVGGLTPKIKRNIFLFAKAAVLTADVLVKELKKGGEE